MKAVVVTDERPRLEVRDVDDLRPGPDEVLVRVTGCGICGSDLHVSSTVAAPGAILGHEIAGIVEGGDGELAPGTPVAVRPFFGCGRCRFCQAGRQDHCAEFELVGMQRPGGFAEFTLAHRGELFVLPTALRPEEQALVEPFAVARRMLRRVGLQSGEDVTVLGAGPIGLAVIHWARALGAKRITVSDPIEHRRALAIDLGADEAVEPAAARGAGAAPVVIECSGKAGVINDAMQLVDVDGRVGVVGICLANDTIFPWWGLNKEADIRFSIYYGREDFTDTIDAFESGRLAPGPMITETIGLDALPERFARLASEADAGKVVVIP